MMKEIVVSDFDGVWTDSSKEAEKYTAAFANKFSQRIGLGLNELHNLMESARETITQSPGLFGWEYKNLIVAPAMADPYIFNQAASRLVLDKLKAENAVSVTLPEDINKLMDELFQECYPLTETVFREGAKKCLTELHRSSRLTIVTNSDTLKVKKKLSKLFGSEDHGLRVIGNARKYLVNNQGGWNIDKTTWLPGLPRPIFLRRPAYNTVLNGQGRIDKVLGDIYELDLALPEAKGITTALFISLTTPRWEVEHYQNHENGFSADNLEELIGLA